MIRDFARAFVILLGLLIVLAEIQRADDETLTESAPPVLTTRNSF